MATRMCSSFKTRVSGGDGALAPDKAVEAMKVTQGHEFHRPVASSSTLVHLHRRSNLRGMDDPQWQTG
jgi:hypothetical protein